MKYTANYNLKKPEGTDIVNIDDLNDNADILDQKLKEVENKADNAPPNSVNDAAIGSRTPDQSQAPASPGTGTLTQLISWLANRIKAITGKTNWWDAPPTTLQAAKNHIDASAPHSGHETPTGAQAKANAAYVAAKQYTNQEVAEVSQALDAHKVAAAPHSGHETPSGAQTKANTALNSAKAYTDQEVAEVSQALDAHVTAAAPHSGHETPTGAQAKVDAHANLTNNPHSVTKSQVGLGSVSNYGLATQAEAEAGTSSAKYMTPLRTKQAIDALQAVKSVAGKTGTVTLTKGDVGLSNVDNTSDMDKPISTAVQTALDGKVDNSRVLTDVPANAKFTDTTYGVATTSTSGLMSSTDKTNLDSNTAARHIHSNKSVIDKFTEVDNKLFYNGEEIGSGGVIVDLGTFTDPTELITHVVMNQLPTGHYTFIMDGFPYFMLLREYDTYYAGTFHNSHSEIYYFHVTKFGVIHEVKYRDFRELMSNITDQLS